MYIILQGGKGTKNNNGSKNVCERIMWCTMSEECGTNGKRDRQTDTYMREYERKRARQELRYQVRQRLQSL